MINKKKKKKQFSKRDDRYEAIYILKVAIEAILLRLELFALCIHRVYGEFNVVTEKENFHAIIKLFERPDQTLIQHLVIT